MDSSLSDSQRFFARRRDARKRRWVKGALFVALFVAIGFVIGVGATMVFVKDRMHRLSPRRDAIAAAMLEKMREHVDVTPDEEARLTELLQKHFDEIEAVRAKSFESVRGVFREMDGTIESVLGPDRFKTWYDYKEKRLAEWRARRR